MKQLRTQNKKNLTPLMCGILAPLFLLLVPANAEGIARSLIIFPVIVWLMSGWCGTQLARNAKTPHGLRGIAVTIVTAAVCGYTFYIRWLPSDYVKEIASTLGFSAQVLVGFSAVLLSCAVMWSMAHMNWLPHDITNALGETYSLDLYVGSEQANSAAARLDRNGWLLCAVLALIGAIVFCNSFPFAGIHQDGDSAVFLYIGREMFRGKIPYVDLFDHKGILLYFIQYVGLLLSVSGTYSGIWLIEWASLFMTAAFMYKTVRMLTTARNISYLVLLIVFICAGTYYQGGNYAEGYALPWITMAVYVYLQFFMTSRYRPVEVAALGVGCTVVAFLRVNMIGVWIAFTPLVVFFLLKERKFADILCCIGCFVGGLAAVCVPLGAYFIRTGSLDSMIKYYIQFNMIYAGSRGFVINQLKAILAIGSGAHIVAIIFAAIAYRYVRFKKIFWINMWGLAVSLLFATMSGRAYDHYGLVLIPLLVLPVWCITQVVVHYLEQTNAENAHIVKILRSHRRAAVITVCLIVCLVVLNSIMQTVIYDYKLDAEAFLYIAEETDENDDVLIIGDKVHCYLECDRKTDNKFFYQNPPTNLSSALYEEFLEEVNSNPSDYIVFYRKSNLTGKLKERLDQWCQEGAYVCEDHGSFVVYRRQDFVTV